MLSPRVICTLLTLLLASTSAGWAAPGGVVVGEPDFFLDRNAWKATDILVVSEGPTIDGRVRVVEVWRGSEQVGEDLELPELTRFAPETARVFGGPRVETRRYGLRVTRDVPGPDETPRVVAADRLVLFLVRKDERLAPVSDAASSLAFVDRGEVFVMGQTWMDLSSVLVREGRESDLRARILELERVREAWTATLAIPEPARRVAALHPYLDEWVLQDEAIEALAACGPQGTAVLLERLRARLSEPFPCVDEHLVRTLVEAGGDLARLELLALLDEEAVFWEGESPDHPQDEGCGHPRAPRLGRMILVLQRLARSSSTPDAISVATRLRRVAVEREDIAIDRDLLPACDRLLEACRRP